MPRDQYYQNEIVMDSQLNDLIKDAQDAFNTLKDIANEFERFAKLEPLTDNEQDNQYVEDYDPMNEDEEAYYERRNDKCGCREQSQSQHYPCICRECDKLKAKAQTQLLVGLNDLKSAFEILDLAKEKFEESIEFLQDADKYFDKAIWCLKRNDCKCYCKSPRRYNHRRSM